MGKNKAKSTSDPFDQVEKHFQEKYFGGKDKSSDDFGNDFRPFGGFTKGDAEKIKNKGTLMGIVYDFKYLLLGGFTFFTVGSVLVIVYKKNQEKRRIDAVEMAKGGKGIVSKLLPLNPV